MLNRCKWLSTEELREVRVDLTYISCVIGGSLASDDLYLLDMRNGEEMA